MISEKDMEDAIVGSPKRYLGEDGLNIIGRQHRIGGYIFDLLFEDRHRGRLIVEIQKGTLDRQHTYKILDYYDAYREHNPSEFIELMVVANTIPEERKKRLRAMGVEFREIPESEFGLFPSSIDSNSSQEQPNTFIQKPVSSNNNVYDVDARGSYLLFKEQKNLFVKELSKIEKNVDFRFNWGDLKPDNIRKRLNWFVVWIPSSWGTFKQSAAGIHLAFSYYRDRKSGIEYIRYPVGVERPLKGEYHDKFKVDVVNSLKKNKIDIPDCRLWPDVGFRGAKLLEPKHEILDHTSWERVLSHYLKLGNFIQVVAETIKDYNENDCFTERIHFK